MRKLAPVILLASASAMLAACGAGGGVFNRERPDEFAVQRQAPLVSMFQESVETSGNSIGGESSQLQVPRYAC